MQISNKVTVETNVHAPIEKVWSVGQNQTILKTGIVPLMIGTLHLLKTTFELEEALFPEWKQRMEALASTWAECMMKLYYTNESPIQWVMAERFKYTLKKTETKPRSLKPLMPRALIQLNFSSKDGRPF